MGHNLVKSLAEAIGPHDKDTFARDAVRTLSRCQVSDICQQCDVDEDMAKALLAVVQKMTKTKDRHEETRPMCQVLELADDSPAFRRSLATTESIVQTESDWIAQVAVSARDFCTSSEYLSVAAQKLKQVLLKPQKQLEEMPEKHRMLQKQLGHKLEPLRQAVSVLEKQFETLTSSFESYFIEPLEDFVENEFKKATEKTKGKLNSAFFQYECRT